LPFPLLPRSRWSDLQAHRDPGLGQQAVAALQDLPGLRMVEMDASLVTTAAQLAADLGLRGADALYVAVAYRLGLPLATLDEDQIKRASEGRQHSRNFCMR
jgi:predicted nucleic acid-binding protein